MDLQMPIMDGYEASRQIRESNQNIPIIAITANAMKEDVEKTKAAGMNEHLNKPIDIEKLYATLLKYISVKIEHVEVSHPTQSTSPLPHAVELHSFKTIDTVAGLKHMAGNEELYRKVLYDFLMRYKEFNLEALREEEFKIATHTLKGLSGNIGATALCIILKELDETYNRELLPTLSKELKEVLQELEDKIPEIKKEITTKEMLPPSLRDALFAKLKKAALTSRPKECSIIMLEIEKYALSPVEDALFMKIKALIEKYDFKEAVIRIENIDDGK
jgi:CheY-like chemotaxis protein